MTALLVAADVVAQCLYLLGMMSVLFLYTRPVNLVETDEAYTLSADQLPTIILLYPVLRELEATMRTTMVSLANIDYPREKYRVVAIPNADDIGTIQSLERIGAEFSFLEILPVPPTSDPLWQRVWRAWDANGNAYWWHVGKQAHDANLPAKKTRQLVYSFYALAESMPADEDWLLNYIDADSSPPRDHFMAAAAGIRHFDVLQSTNVAGNLMDTWATSFHAMDHMGWDGFLYPHLSANGRQPFWVLGKGLFFRFSDLLSVGSFNPWLAIEDPEVGMRLWSNGKRLGVIEAPLIEEVPATFRQGITQRKRWICGFCQSLSMPLRLMGMTRRERFRARLNFAPCFSLLVNILGLPLGILALVSALDGESPLPMAVVWLAWTNMSLLALMLSLVTWSAWRRSKLVLPSLLARARFMLRVNPVFMVVYWLFWIVPLAIGIAMFLRDGGQTWQRTIKVDANHDLVRDHTRDAAPSPGRAAEHAEA